MKSIIYIKVLDENINVWKPINALCIDENTYKIDDNDDEIEFKKGQIIKVVKKIFSDGTKGLVPYEA